MMNTMLALAAAVLGQVRPPETITVFQDDTIIDRSCIVVIPPGVVIEDARGDGVIHIAADGITVEFHGGSTLLRGAPEGTPWDELKGIGVRIDGRKDVTLRGARVHGFRVGVYASDADGLVLEDCDVSDNFARRLRSTARAEDGSDWLWPHRNDQREWMENYGAGICLERSGGVTVRRCRARRVQNGLILDRVSGSRVYDNDFSFLSGWGLAMWRSSENAITRNALDFCVRGYSHGVYNRGQDSAGLLMFEQNSRNVIAENSATHGGDGFFGHAGREALGEAPPPVEGFDHRRRGNNDNLLVNNDFSYAPAHGIEMTFSFGNRLIGNRLVANAICGVWGGYSQEMLIAGNRLEGNGEMAYGLERGGVNIEHGIANVIVDNQFRENACGVHLWWDADEGLMKTPWAAANTRGDGERMVPSLDNIIARNTFEGDALGIQLRETDRTVVFGNRMQNVKTPLEVSGGAAPEETAVEVPEWEVPEYPVFGQARPVGARMHLRGRDKIIMGEWFPWDHESVLVRGTGSAGSGRIYEVYGAGEVRARALSGDVRVGVEPIAGVVGVAGSRVKIEAEGTGVVPYRVRVESPRMDGGGAELAGTMLAARWDVVFFPWTVDPREDLTGWRAEAKGQSAVRVVTPVLEFRHGHGGPGGVEWLREHRERMPWRDRFGMIARTRLELPKGTYRFTTLSDDGVRVAADGEMIIENWTWHGPTRDTGRLVREADGEVEIIVEHFEIDGYAVLELTIERE